MPDERPIAQAGKLDRMGGNAYSECQRLLDQYGQCIEQAHDLRSQACGLELIPDRAKVFELALSRLEREAVALKQELTEHQQRFHHR
jgi:hypothetical protein